MPDTLQSNRNVFCPVTVAKVPTGEVFIASGLEKPQRWDGVSSATENAGVTKCATGNDDAASIGLPTGSGSITGLYTWAVRYLDDESIPGDLSEALTFTAASDATIAYSNLATASSIRATQRQIFRSTAGQSKVLYLDNTISDLTTTEVSSTTSDADLITSTALAINAPDQSINARRFGVPPDDKQVVVHHNDRTFWGVTPIYDEGHVSITNGSATVTGVGTNFTNDMVNRRFNVVAQTGEYTVSAASATAQTLTLGVNFGGTTDVFANYSVTAARGRRNSIDFSYAAEPESVLATDTIILEQDGTNEEEISGLHRFGSFLYIFTERNVYRWTFDTHPVAGGAIYHEATRGLLNQRCATRVEDLLFCMDREGIYMFNGGTVDPVSNVIQDFFREQVVWHNAKWFWASSDPAEETVKFFVALDGSYYPRHALCFHYRSFRWWTEEYPCEVGAGDVVPVASTRRLLLGGENERVLLTREGTLDGPEEQITSRGTIASATQTSVTVDSPVYTVADIRGWNIAITSGTGKGQERRILDANASTGRIDIDRPWSVKPDSTSKYQIGGVKWQFRTGRLSYAAEDSANPREVGVVVTPSASTCSYDVQLHENFKTSPTAATEAVDNDHGAFSVKDEPRIEQNMAVTFSDTTWDGYGWWRFAGGYEQRGPADRYVKVDLSGYQNKDRVKIHSVHVGGVTD